MKIRSVLVFLGVLALLFSTGISGVQAFGTLERVSVDSSGNQSDGSSYGPNISSDGRYVAFYSNDATNLVSPPTSHPEVYVRDRTTGLTTLASVNSSGVQGDNGSSYPTISSDGRYVAFQSYASNLVPGATNHQQIYVRDRVANTTTRVSADLGGSYGDGDSNYPHISADGRYVAFDSSATNLVANDTNGKSDVFVRDLQTNTTTKVSVSSGGIDGNEDSSSPGISPDGRYVVFRSFATNLVSGINNGKAQTYVRDRQANTTTVVSVDPGGAPGNDDSFLYPSISADGRYVAFSSYATNLVSGDTNGDWDVFVRDRLTNTTTRISIDSNGNQSNGYSEEASISGDGRYVAFYSYATNLVTPNTTHYHVFLRDIKSGTTTLIDADSSGTPGNDNSQDPCMSSDGRYVTFYSDASNLIPGDTNHKADIFVLALPQTTTASVNTNVGNFTFKTSNGSISGLIHMDAPSELGFLAGYFFPYGMFSFKITNLTPGQSVTVTIKFPAGIPANAQYWKWQNGNLINMSPYMTLLDSNTIALTIRDGGQGDADGSANGTIVDPGGLAVPMETKSISPHGASMPTAPQGPVSLPNIAVKSASLSAAKVAPGTPITVTANVANSGGVNGSSRITLYVNGQEESSQGITVNSGSNTPVTFNVSRNEPGTYTVYVGGTNAGSFIVDEFAGPGVVAAGVSALFLLVFIAVIVIYRRKSQFSR